MRADEVYAILLKKIRSSGGEISPEQLQEAIKNYLQKNPISTNIKEERPQETTYALKPNVQAVWGEVIELNLTLEEELPDAVNIYPFWFTSGSTPTKVILPSTIALDGFATQANKKYCCQIEQNVLFWKEFDIT